MPQNQESTRLKEARDANTPWRKWGPYLSERQWGTVREDYSPGGDAWDYFTHDQARSRAYHWGEDGLAGISDDNQLLCFSLALWNGKDPILKERAFGLTNSEANHGEDVKEYYFYLDSTPTHSYMKYLYKYPQAAYPYSDLVETNRHRGRHEFEYELLDTGVFDQNRCFDVFAEDVTERRVLERQLQMAGKMEAVGRLSGGIAHDFNNLLGVIIGYSQVLKRRLDPGSALLEHAVEIEKAGQRAASLTRQLLAFSRQQILTPAILNMNDLVLDMAKMLPRLLGEDIAVSTSLCADLGMVKADQGQIEQVIMNLAVNGRDAMPEGGTLKIETANVEVVVGTGHRIAERIVPVEDARAKLQKA